jgi:hypothetical protein
MADLSKIIVQNTASTFYEVIRAFDPSDIANDNKTVTDLCPWYKSPVAAFKIGYL